MLSVHNICLTFKNAVHANKSNLFAFVPIGTSCHPRYHSYMTLKPLMRSVWLTFVAVKVQLIGVHTAKDVLNESNKIASLIEMVS